MVQHLDSTPTEQADWVMVAITEPPERAPQTASSYRIEKFALADRHATLKLSWQPSQGSHRAADASQSPELAQVPPPGSSEVATPCIVVGINSSNIDTLSVSNADQEIGVLQPTKSGLK